MDRLKPPENVSFFGKYAKQFYRPAFIAVLDSKVRVIPVTKTSEPLKFFSL
jgi:hypothetical protein